VTTSAERLEELRQRALAAEIEPISEPEELARQSIRAHLEDVWGIVPPDLPEVGIRLHGPGVPGHDIAVREAAGILTSFQETIASIGQVLSHRATATGPINAQVLKSTELRLFPTPSPGSVIFHLTGPGEEISGAEAPALTGTDTLVDAAMHELFALVAKSAKADELETAGSLARDLRRFGPRVAKHLAELADHIVKDEIDMDLTWRTPRGRRRSATLERRSAQTIRDAIKLNEVETLRVELTGTLSTISTTKKAELKTASQGIVRIAVDDQQAASLGPFFNQPVVIVAEQTTKWSTETGRETRSYQLLDIALAKPATRTELPSALGLASNGGFAARTTATDSVFLLRQAAGLQHS